MAIVASAHLALFAWLVIPRAPRPLRALGLRAWTGVLQVSLLVSPPPERAAPTHLPRMPTIRPSRTLAPHARELINRPRVVQSPQVVLRPAPSSSAGTPAFIAGGGFAARLQTTQTTPSTPKLPGGHQYTTEPLQFMSIEQTSVAGRIRKIAGPLFGWFDPACKNAQYELAKTRKQQIADGYTREDLKRLVREHCR